MEFTGLFSSCRSGRVNTGASPQTFVKNSRSVAGFVEMFPRWGLSMMIFHVIMLESPVAPLMPQEWVPCCMVMLANLPQSVATTLPYYCFCRERKVLFFFLLPPPLWLVCCVCGWSDSRSEHVKLHVFLAARSLSSFCFVVSLLLSLHALSTPLLLIQSPLYASPPHPLFFFCAFLYASDQGAWIFQCLFLPFLVSPCLLASIELRSFFFSTPPFLQWGFFLSFPSSSVVSLLSLRALSGSPAAVVLNWCFSASAFILCLFFPFLSSPPSSSFLLLLPPPSPPHPWRKKTGIRQTASCLCTWSFPVCVCVSGFMCIVSF